MPFTKFTNLDFDQIKTSIKDYLRANSTFTDFDFEGLKNRDIVIKQHCFGCTAGEGSSCGGSLSV